MSCSSQIVKRFKNLFLVGLTGLAIFLEACGSSSGAPPLSIPAPATANITISSPDAQGLVTVTGAAVEARANFIIQATNTTASSALLEELINLLISEALAQVAVACGDHCVQTTAAADGSFSLQIEADRDDVLSIVLMDPDTNTESDPIEESVPDNVPALRMVPRALAIDQANNQAFVVGVLADTGMVTVVDLQNNTVASSFELSTNDPQDIAFDSIDNELLIPDLSGNIVLIVSLDNTDVANQRGIDVQSPESIAIDALGGLAIVGTQSPGSGVVLIDLAVEGIFAGAAIENIADPTARYQESPAVDAFNNRGVIISNFDDGSAQVTAKDLNPPAFTNREAFVESEFSGVALLNANAALVVDEVNNRVLFADLTGATAATAVTVGNAPEAVAVDQAQARAFVVNSGDNTVSTIDLTAQSVTATQDTGLSPEDVAYNTGLNALVILNAGDNTLTILK